jgi:hypothetical protein
LAVKALHPRFSSLYVKSSVRFRTHLFESDQRVIPRIDALPA